MILLMLALIADHNGLLSIPWWIYIYLIMIDFVIMFRWVTT